jgi:hypothetical protein
MIIINNDAMQNGTREHTSIASVDDTRRNMIVFMRSRTNCVIRKYSMAIAFHRTIIPRSLN